MSARPFPEGFRWLASTGLALLMLLFALPASAEDTAGSFLDRYQVAELKNGIRVLALSEPESPLAVVQIWFRAGRADGPASHPGVAELCSRVLFRSKLREILARHHPDLFERGVRVDSLCNQDTSFCSLEGPAEALQACTDTLARLLAAPFRFSEATVQVQRRLLMQEAQRLEASPQARFERLIRQQLFSVHPYGRSVSSALYDRDHLPPDVLTRFARTVFCPANLLVVIAGPGSAKDLTMVAARAFSSWATLEEERTTRLIEPKIVKSRSCHLVADVDRARVALAFVAPAAKSDEAVTAQLLARMLDSNGSSHLRKQIFGPWLDVAKIRVHYAPHRDPSLFSIELEAPELDPDRVAGELLHRIEGLELASFSVSEIAKEKARHVARFLAEHQTLYERARRLGRMACTHGPERLKTELRKFMALRAENLLAFVRENLRPDGCCVVSVGPTRDAEPLGHDRRPVPETPLFPEGRPLLAPPFGRAVHHVVGDGRELAFRITIRMARPDRGGSVQIARSLRRHVEERLAEKAIDGGWWLELPDYENFAPDLVELQLNCERSVVPEVLPHFLKNVVEAGTDAPLPLPVPAPPRPRFDERSTAERAARRLLRAFAQAETGAPLSETPPPAFPDRDALTLVWRRNFVPERCSLVVCGACEAGVIDEALRRTFPDSIPSRSASSPSTATATLTTGPLLHLPSVAVAPPRPAASPHRPAESFRHVVDTADPHGLVVVGVAVSDLAGPDAVNALLLAEILGRGENSRLVRGIRDGLGLGFASGSRYMPLAGGGYLLAWIGVHPDRLAVAEQALVEEFLRPSREPVSPSELVQARATLQTRWTARMQSSLRAAPLLGRLLARTGASSPRELLARSMATTTKDLLEGARHCMDRHGIYVERPVTTARSPRPTSLRDDDRR